MRALLAFAIALFIAGSGTARAQDNAALARPPGPGESWREFARQDVQGAYDLYVANHPGMHDPVNRSFPAQLRRARAQGLAQAERATDYAGYVQALGAFSAGLADGHAQAFARPLTQGPVPREWPGFLTAWRRDRMLVHYAGPDSPVPVGTQILACNGRNVRAFVTGRLANLNFRPAEAGIWWMSAPTAFYSSPLLRNDRPERCNVRLPDGRRRDVALSWSPMPADYFDRLRLATDGERTEIGLSEPRPGLFLVGMPDFNPNQAGVEAYRRLFATLHERRAELGRARAVVVDLRHNNGGSSEWSRQAAEALWGEAAVAGALRRYFRNVAIWWRASEGNIAYMADLERQLRGNGLNAVADNIRSAGAGMRAAAAAGRPYYVEREQTDSAPAALSSAQPFSTPVYLITPGRCGSACLDATDLFSLFPNVRRIGAPTSADSNYMEVRPVDLPSGRGRISIPNKIWMNRPRPAGSVYRPHIPVNDLDWSTRTFLDHVERDLASRR